MDFWERLNDEQLREIVRELQLSAQGRKEFALAVQRVTDKQATPRPVPACPICGKPNPFPRIDMPGKCVGHTREAWDRHARRTRE